MMAAASLDAVFLDVGNTLVSMRMDLVAEFLRAEGVVFATSALERAEAAVRPIASNRIARGGALEGEDGLASMLSDMVARLDPGFSDEPARRRISRAVARRLRAAVPTQTLWSQVLPGTEEALGLLKKRNLRVVAVSNSDGTVESGLVASGLRPYFDAVIDSHCVGYEKPDPRIFEEALTAARTPAARAVHLGDLYAVDVIGARRAGVRGILVDPFDDYEAVDCLRFVTVVAFARQICAS